MLWLHTALNAEAKPLREHFRLTRLEDSRGVGAYINRDRDIGLVVSGVGTTAAATAIGYVAGRDKSEPSCFCNVGIAGSRTYAIGAIIVGSKIVDVEQDQRYYPTSLVPRQFKRCTIHTVSTPETNFDHDGVYDMEASGFFAAAARFAPPELITSVKIVSDGPNSDLQQINRDRIEQLIGSALSDVEGVVAELRETLLGVPRREHTIANQLMTRLHFTQTQRHQLLRELDRLASMQTEPHLDKLAQKSDARGVLKLLRWQADHTAQRYRLDQSRD